jgi:hypothetical protein
MSWFLETFFVPTQIGNPVHGLAVAFAWLFSIFAIGAAIAWLIG